MSIAMGSSYPPRSTWPGTSSGYTSMSLTTQSASVPLVEAIGHGLRRIGNVLIERRRVTGRGRLAQRHRLGEFAVRGWQGQRRVRARCSRHELGGAVRRPIEDHGRRARYHRLDSSGVQDRDRDANLVGGPRDPLNARRRNCQIFAACVAVYPPHQRQSSACSASSNVW